MTPRLRHEYPGVAPWQWEQHPDWLQRVQCGLISEIEGAQIKADYEKKKG